jgi:hypothetical protein
MLTMLGRRASLVKGHLLGLEAVVTCVEQNLNQNIAYRQARYLPVTKIIARPRCRTREPLNNYTV